MRKVSKEKEVTDLVADSYAHHSRLLKEEALGIIELSESEHRTCKRVVSHIEILVSYLDERDKFIIENEVLRGKKGTWYLNYCSTPTYYRYRNRAYVVFFKLLNS